MTTVEAWPGQMGIAATCGSPKGFPGGGQVRGGGAAAALASSTGRGACAIRGSNCLKCGAIWLVWSRLAGRKKAGVGVPDSIGRGGRIISESGAALIGVGIVRAESCENCRPARKFPHKLCYAEAE